MKRIIQAVVVAALFTGMQAKAEDAPIVVPSQWTYAERSTAPAGAPVSAFAGSIDEMIVLESKSTYADLHAASSAQEPVVSAFAGSIDEMIVLTSKSTYADRFVTEPTRQASGPADPALSE
jgi:hypothetical protein